MSTLSVKHCLAAFCLAVFGFQIATAVWHPGAHKKGAPEPQMITFGDSDVQAEAKIRMKRVWREQSAPEESP